MREISNNDIAHSIYLSLLEKKGEDLSWANKRVVDFLYRRGLLSQSENILESIINIINKKEGKVVAKISGAEPLSAKNKTELSHILKERYSAKEVLFEESSNKALIGGWKIEARGEIIDTTLRAKIKKLQTSLIN